MANASMYAGIAQGLSQVADYERERPDREMRREEARLRQESGQFKFEQMKQAAPLQREQTELELEKLRAEVKSQKQARLKTETFGAFRNYNSDKDTRHLNNFLKTAKSMGDPTWSHWARFDEVTRNYETEAMLGQAGIMNVEEYFNDPELLASKVLATDANGERTLLDMEKLQAATGYTQHMTTEELKAARERAELEKLLIGTESATTNIVRKIAKEEKISLLEAYRMYKEAEGTKEAGSTVERIATKLREADPTLSHADSIREATRIQAAPSGAEKDINVTAEVREKLHTLSPTGSFYDLDLTDPKNREKAGELIIDLEHATGRKLDSATKTAARKMRSLLALGGKAGDKISEAETGLIDHMLHKVKKYFSDNVEGTEGQATYELFRNMQRNALFGATLPAAEMSAFNAAAGTLGMQLGPALDHLVVGMEDTKESLQAIIDFEDPMAAKYYLGTSMEQAEMAIDAINERLDFIQDFRGKNTKVTLDDVKADEKKAEFKVAIPPAQVTPGGAKPAKSAAERWKELKGEG